MKEEKKRLQLSKEEIGRKEAMLAQEEAKKRNAEQQIIQAEENHKYEVGMKQLELQIAQTSAQLELGRKLLPIYKEQLKNEQPRKDGLASLKQLRDMFKITESNIKVLKRQISTKMA